MLWSRWTNKVCCQWTCALHSYLLTDDWCTSCFFRSFNPSNAMFRISIPRMQCSCHSISRMQCSCHSISRMQCSGLSIPWMQCLCHSIPPNAMFRSFNPLNAMFRSFNPRMQCSGLSIPQMQCSGLSIPECNVQVFQSPECNANMTRTVDIKRIWTHIRWSVIRHFSPLEEVTFGTKSTSIFGSLTTSWKVIDSRIWTRVSKYVF